MFVVVNSVPVTTINSAVLEQQRFLLRCIIELLLGCLGTLDIKLLTRNLN